MATATATLSNFRQSPRKMRLVADLVRGKKVSEALTHLEFTAKRASSPLRTLLQSALANAKNLDMSADSLVISKITVNSGKTLYRRRPAARGSAHPIRKRTSVIFVEVSDEPRENKTKIKKEK